MKSVPILIFLISFSLLCGLSAALEESEVDITSDSQWITAGGNGAEITVEITNLSVSVSSVEFYCTQPEIYGEPDITSDSSSPYTTTFSSIRSGEPSIVAEVKYIVDDSEYSLSKIITLNVDHSVPERISYLNYDYESEVGSEIDISVRMTDTYENIIDSRREDAEGTLAEEITFSSSGGTSGFWNGADYSDDTITETVSSDGFVNVRFLISTTPGENLINIEPPEPLSQNLIVINGISTAPPAVIESAVSPHAADPPYVPADGETPFTVTYFLYDLHGNPSGNRTVTISSSDPNEDDFNLRSSSAGRISVTYGPKSQKGLFTLTATSTDNSSASVSNDLLFDSTEPVNMLLTANPETMPSVDVLPDSKSLIRAKVIDERGNPVKNEEVSFSLEDKTYPLYQTEGPQLLQTTAESDEYGQAIVEFIPGEFETAWSSPDFNELAEANCTVTAHWGNVSRSIKVEWKNYPYISVTTLAEPETVAVNDTVDVSVSIYGDGYALTPDPIDVMVSVDRSGSMLKDYPDRMVSAMSALKTFSAEMSEGRDQVGIASFGVSGSANIYYYGYDYWSGRDDRSSDDGSYISLHYPGNGKYYSSYATVDLSLTTSRSSFDYEVDRIVPMSGTPMRKGLYLAIKELVDNGRADAVKGVILLSDGDYNYYGDPLARGYAGYYYYYGYKYYYSGPTDYGTLTENYYPFSDLTSAEQNLTVYANNNNITIYSIAFADSISSNGREVLKKIAECTGGEYYYAPTGNDLEAIYTSIAGELKTEAGVNTTMQLVFDNIELNNVTVPNTAEDPVIDYLYLDGFSTTIESWNSTATITPLYTEDQTPDWADDQNLDFNIGTIRLGQHWETNFRLKIMKSGNLNIFGSGSTISFNNGTDYLTLPATYVTAVADLNSTGITSTELDIEELTVTSGDIVTDRFDLGWKVNYSGSEQVSHKIYYLREGDGIWLPYKTLSGLSGPLVDYTSSETINVYGMPSGNYLFRVIASATDAADDSETVSVGIGVASGNVSYIKIE
jgi:hypothetical protein